MKNQMSGLVTTLLLAATWGVCGAAPEDGGFSAVFRIDLDGISGYEELYSAPGSWKLVLRDAGEDKDLARYDEWLGNYLNFRLPNGKATILDAIAPDVPHSIHGYYHDVPNGCRVGVPLGALKDPTGVHEVRVTFAKTRWQMRVDDVVVDEDGLVAPMRLPVEAEAKALSPRVKSVTLAMPAPADALGAEPDARLVTEPIQYWTAGGFNTWVGDVVVANWKGRFHVFYLKDRRHHRGKGGSGGHYFAHISSDDLVHWMEHPVVTPLDEYWFTCGTGTPFVFDGKFCLAYGIHSTRFVKRERTTEPAMLAELAKTGVMPAVKFAGTDLIPLGCTWAESDDGIRFRPSGIVFHTTQNPAIENLPDGTMRLTTGYGGDTGAKGFWASDRMTGWRQIPGRSPLAGDCPCPFEWNGLEYLLQGFGGYAMKKADGSGYDSLRGSDIYDGSNVPMVAPWKGGRRLMVAWVRHFYGWGGWLLFRELVQREDGSLGTKWVPEIAPPTPPMEFSGVAGQPFRKRFEKVGGGRPLEFGIDPSHGSAYFADVLADGKLEKFGDRALCQSLDVTGIRGLDRDYRVRIVAHYDRKANATVFDAEIAGNRTIVCRRPGRFTVR